MDSLLGMVTICSLAPLIRENSFKLNGTAEKKNLLLMIAGIVMGKGYQSHALWR